MLAPVTVEPLYEKVKVQLLSYIDIEKPKILPREKDLIRLFNVSRNTVRHAVQDLTNSGVLKPIQGRGTIVIKYAESKGHDIGVICTDSLDVTEPWISSIMKGLKHAAHREGFHLNLFFCHDYSINHTTDSAYSYLINSGKLAGLILLSALKFDDIAYIKRIGLPFVTLDFKYQTFNTPALLPLSIETIEKSMEKYAEKGMKYFGMVAKRTESLRENECFGINDLIIENWELVLRRKKLPVIAFDYNLNIADQVRKMHTLPPGNRPEVLFTPFIPYINEVKKALAEYADWNPVHIVTAIKGNKSTTPCIVVDPDLYAKKAFKTLHQIIVKN
jgi:regulatory GntR family protein